MKKTVFLAAIAMGTSASAATATINTSLSDTFSTQSFAPYMDALAWPPPSVSTCGAATGNWNYSMAFLTGGSDGSTNLYWGGYASMPVRATSQNGSDSALIQNINGARANGGSVRFSFGGASATYMPEGNSTVASDVASSYQQVINTYNARYLDFDIEGSWITNNSATAVRSQAISLLQQSNPGVKFSYTLPTGSTGLAASGKAQIQSLLNAGGHLNMVNIMAMDYGESGLPAMGIAATNAATGTFNFLKTEFASRGIVKTDAQIWAMIGVTVMIGINDVTSEVFTQTDARTLLAFAQQNKIGMISMWSQGRDTTGTLGVVSGTGSGIAQTDYEFSDIFSAYNVTAVPEPGAWGASAAIGAGVLAAMRRRRRRAA